MRYVTAVLFSFLLTFLFSCSGSKYEIDSSTLKDVKDFSESFAAFQAGNLWGYINSSGDYVIKPQFHDASRFSEKYASVKLNNKWGFINTSGIFEINPQFDGAKEFCGKLAPVKKNNSWGYINNKNDLVIDYQFEDANCFSGDFASVKLGGKWGFINKNGQYVINPIYDDAGYFFEELAPVRSAAHENKWGFIDKSGKYIIQPQYDDAKSFSFIDDSYSTLALAAVMIDGEWGYIDIDGKNIINLQYDEALPYNEGLAPVKSGENWGYIDGKNRNVINPQFTSAFCTCNNYCLVVKDGNKYFVDKKGNDAGLITVPLVSGSESLGKFTPPKPRYFNEGVFYLKFYNFSRDTIRLYSSQMNTEDSANIDGAIISPSMFFSPQKGIKHPEGFIYIYIANSLYCKLWFFSYHDGLERLNGMTILGADTTKFKSFYKPFNTYQNTDWSYCAMYCTSGQYTIYAQGIYSYTDVPKNDNILNNNVSILIENTDKPVVPKY
jgi:hypothetical protein